MLLQFCSVFIVCVVMQMYRCHDTCVKVRGNRSGVGFPTSAFKQQTRFRRLTGQALFIHQIIKDAPKGLIYRELHNYTRWSLFLSETNAVFLKTDRIFFLFKLLYMCMCAHVYMYTWVWVLMASRRGHRISRIWSYRSLWPTPLCAEKKTGFLCKNHLSSPSVCSLDIKRMYFNISQYVISVLR